MKSCAGIDRAPFEPMVEPLPETSHHVFWNRKISISYRAVSQMTCAYTDLNEMTRSAVTVAEEPYIRCYSRILDAGLELGADFDVGHGYWEAPEVLGREVVPVVWGPFASRFGNASIANPHYVMNSRHLSREIITDKCALRKSDDYFSRISLSQNNIKGNGYVCKRSSSLMLPGRLQHT